MEAIIYRFSHDALFKLTETLSAAYSLSFKYLIENEMKFVPMKPKQYKII